MSVVIRLLSPSNPPFLEIDSELQTGQFASAQYPPCHPCRIPAKSVRQGDHLEQVVIPPDISALHYQNIVMDIEQ